MFKRFVGPIISTAALAFASQTASAGVIEVVEYGNSHLGYNGAVEAQSLGGYDLKSFNDSGLAAYTEVSSATSPVDGQLLLLSDNDRDSQKVTLQEANSTAWWSNLESDGLGGYTYGDDYEIYTTTYNMIEIILPQNTLAFAFNVGANFRGNAWFDVYSNHSNTVADYESDTFRVGGPRNENYLTPGFGLYADNSNYVSGGDCNYISRIVVDPNAGWGVGNFAIAQDTNNTCSTTTVSEPGSLALLGLGILGLVAIRRKNA